LLWAFRRKTATAESHTSNSGRTVEFHGATLLRTLADSLAQRGNPKIQRDLMFEALNCIHDVARMRGLTVVHTFISTTPDWYVGQVATSLVNQRTSRCRVVVTEALRTGRITDPIDNAHSGSTSMPTSISSGRRPMERLDATDLLRDGPPTEA
jgi:hypothetical protein